MGRYRTQSAAVKQAHLPNAIRVRVPVTDIYEIAI